MMLSEKRATRGTRMTQLVGEAADQDEQFWGADVWEEDEEEFSEVEAEPDVFDSDFNDTEDDDDDEDDEDEKEAKKAGQRERSTSNKYKEPGPKVKRPPTAPKAASSSSSSSPSSSSSAAGGEEEGGGGGGGGVGAGDGDGRPRKKHRSSRDPMEGHAAGPREVPMEHPSRHTPCLILNLTLLICRCGTRPRLNPRWPI